MITLLIEKPPAIHFPILYGADCISASNTHTHTLTHIFLSLTCSLCVFFLAHTTVLMVFFSLAFTPFAICPIPGLITVWRRNKCARKRVENSWLSLTLSVFHSFFRSRFVYTFRSAQGKYFHLNFVIVHKPFCFMPCTARSIVFCYLFFSRSFLTRIRHVKKIIFYLLSSFASCSLPRMDRTSGSSEREVEESEARIDCKMQCSEEMQQISMAVATTTTTATPIIKWALK